MLTNEFVKKMKSLNKEVQDIRTKMVNEAKNSFKEIVKEIFNNHPSLESFAWVQYTPYFNDGDACEFSAYTDSIYINDEDDTTDINGMRRFVEEVLDKENTIQRLNSEMIRTNYKEYYQYRIKEIESANLDDLKVQLNMVKDITDVLTSMDDDTLQEVFGDHVKVVVTRDGIEIEEYEHD
jgi:hypothetical protein